MKIIFIFFLSVYGITSIFLSVKNILVNEATDKFTGNFLLSGLIALLFDIILLLTL